MTCVPLPLLTDSYKVTHFRQYPQMIKMSVYGEFRSSFDKDAEDHRLVYYGTRHIIENYVSKQWTMDDLEKSELFFSSHNVGHSAFPWPRDLFHKIVAENNGYFPVKIEALPEGSVVYPHTPVIVISASAEFASLTSYLESVLMMVWYPSAVATLSRRCKDTIISFFDLTVDSSDYCLLDSRLHDFGFRGCTSVEQAMIGGSAHLLNFKGTDTLVAAYHTQFHLNEGRPIGESIPASEHSVMICFEDERAALLHIIEEYGSGVFACVMDSYDYVSALNTILPSIASYKLKKGGFLVLRPDSGNPVEVVLQALRAAESTFGASRNSKGFKVLNGISVIQGDGISHFQIKSILSAAADEGFAAQNIAFGMGGALLQKVHRDIASFAMKASFVEYSESNSRDLCKFPKTDCAKLSLPGEFVLEKPSLNSPIKVYPKESLYGKTLLQEDKNALHVVYDCGPVQNKSPWDSFDVIRERLSSQWTALPKIADPISSELYEKIDCCRQRQLSKNNLIYGDDYKRI